MSGAEFVVLIGVIGSVIAVVDGCQKVYHVYKDKRGLPKEFRKIANDLSLVRDILRAAKITEIQAQDKYKKVNTDEQLKQTLLDTTQSMTAGMESCLENAERLKSIFDSVLPSKDGESKTTPFRRLYNSLSIVRPGLGMQVKQEFEELLQRLQLLHHHRFFRMGFVNSAELYEDERLVDVAAVGEKLNKGWNVRSPMVNEQWERTNTYNWTQFLQDNSTTTNNTSSTHTGHIYHNKDTIITNQGVVYHNYC